MPVGQEAKGPSPSQAFISALSSSTVPLHLAAGLQVQPCYCLVLNPESGDELCAVSSKCLQLPGRRGAGAALRRCCLWFPFSLLSLLLVL